jgi:hypothetical protein
MRAIINLLLGAGMVGMCDSCHPGYIFETGRKTIGLLYHFKGLSVIFGILKVDTSLICSIFPPVRIEQNPETNEPTK